MHPLALLMHAIGRLTCPIMCYFIAEGYHYTRSFQKYALRLFLLAIVSHFAYQFFSFGGHVGWRVFLPFSYGSVLNQTSVMARIASSFSSFPQSPRGCKTDWDMANS